MNTRTKFIICITAGISISLLMGQCKSPPPQAEASLPSRADTVPTPDTAKTVITAPAPIAPPKVIHTPLTLVIRNLASTTAPGIVGLYGINNKFLDPKDQLKEYHFTPNGQELIAKIEDVRFGVYAMAIYQDVNSNGKIDKNLIGIPTEPYAFSNNYHPRIKAPGFDNCKFEYDSVSNTVTMNMIK